MKMSVVKKQKQKILITSAISIMALGLVNFSFAQSVGGVIKGAPAQQPQPQYSGSGNVQPVNQNTQLLLQLQSLRAELASLRNQVEQQGYQLRQLQQSSGNVGSGNINNNSAAQSVTNSSINTQPALNSTSGNGEILPEQSSVGPNSVPNNATGQDSLQFPLLPQDQTPQGQAVDVNNSNNPQALPQLIPSPSDQSQQYAQGQVESRRTSPQTQRQQPLSRQAQLLEDGDKLRGVRTNLGELELYLSLIHI